MPQASSEKPSGVVTITVSALLYGCSRPEVKATRNKPHFNRPFGEGVFTKRAPFTPADAQWWAENSPTRNDGFRVVGPSDSRWDELAELEMAQARIDMGLLL